MFALLAFLIAVAVSFGGFLEARSFVRRKLRFVDAVQSPLAPILAGVAAACIAAPIVWILPVVGVGTALGFGLSVGAGVASGARDVKSGRLLHD